MEAPGSTPSADRRTEARKPLRVRVRLRLAGHAPTELRSVDLSSGGMGLVADVNLPLGLAGDVGFTLRFPNGSSLDVQADATIIHSVFSSSHDGFIIGLQFREPSADLQAALRRYLRS